MEKQYFLNNKIILRKEKFGGLAAKGGTIELYYFNKVGYEILRLCKETPQSIESIKDTLRNKYKVSIDILTQDVQASINYALQNNLVIESGEPMC